MLTPGCSILKEQPCDAPDSSIAGTSDEIQRLLSMIARRNEDLKTFKGIGKASLKDGQELNSVRVAWIASRPDKIRFEILGIPGKSSASLSFDGTDYYFLSHREGKFYKGESDGAMFESITSIPVKAQDVVNIMAGRIPVIDFDSAVIERDELMTGYILFLKKDWFGKSEKIYFDEKKTKINKLEIFNFLGSLEYRAEFEKMCFVNNYLFPFVLSLSSGDGAFFRLETERSYADIPVSQSAFVLKSYDSYEKSYSP
ncbi:MAG: DUF4292 domain-containing protein [Deltaproteobacteria bacterium]|nr:DUF4292 domain-containing protein [Deltaproteobacteria bacterium]